MEMESLIEDMKRKALLLDEDMNYFQKLCAKVIDLADKKEQDFHNLVANMARYPKVEGEIVRFNVGGTLFATSRSNITKKILIEDSLPPSPANKPKDEVKLENADKYYEPNMLEGLVNGLVEVTLDSSGAIFIDRDPKYFSLVLNYLRVANTNTEFKLGPKFEELDELYEEAEFYNVKALTDWLYPRLVIPSAILSKNQLTRSLISLVEPIAHIGSQFKRLKLLYRATEHGFSSSAFHQRCDSKGKTLTLIKADSTGYIFGGYTSTSWDSSGNYRPDKEAFVFSLVNKNHRQLVIKVDPTAISNAIYCSSSYGPIFGSGHDIFICNNANSSNESCSNLGPSYKHPDYVYQSNEAKTLFAGSHQFKAAEIEVFLVQ